MAKILAITLLTSLSLFVTACGSASSTLSYNETPRLDFECSLADALGCDATNAGKNVFIGLDADTSLNCGSKLAHLSLNPSYDQLGYSFDYSSLTQTEALGGILKGIATHWVNSSLMPMYSVPTKTYKVCAFIDLNGNEALDLFEPLQESTISIGTDFYPLSNWTHY